jgi:hypothetical protein
LSIATEVTVLAMCSYIPFAYLFITATFHFQSCACLPSTVTSQPIPDFFFFWFCTLTHIIILSNTTQFLILFCSVFPFHKFLWYILLTAESSASEQGLVAGFC